MGRGGGLVSNTVDAGGGGGGGSNPLGSRVVNNI